MEESKNLETMKVRKSSGQKKLDPVLGKEDAGCIHRVWKQKD
jgi:hypothetical protein